MKISVTNSAPGDGNTALVAALRSELASMGVKVSEPGRAPAYRVDISVRSGMPRNGIQSIEIVWLVTNPRGKRLGRVIQRNEIPAGSLDDAWGLTAKHSAGAAARGIVKFLPQPK